MQSTCNTTLAMNIFQIHIGRMGHKSCTVETSDQCNSVICRLTSDVHMYRTSIQKPRSQRRFT